MRKHPDYVHGFVDRHGKARYYFRRPGFKRVSLPGIPWAPEFMAAYETALAGQPVRREIGASRTAPGSVNAAIVAYYQSTRFLSLAEGTRKSRRALLERFRREHGDKRFALLPKEFIVRTIGRRSPSAARNLLKALRHLIQFGVAEGFRSDDPSRDVKPPRLPQSDGHHTWSETEIEKFEKAHAIGTRPRLAFALLLYTAQRRSDVVRMGPQHVRDGVLHVRQQKTGTTLEIPVDPDLASIVAASAGEHLTFLVTEQGQPFSSAGFGNIFRDWCNEAALPKGCTAHGLRKAACRRLAEAGCTVHQIMSISGHRSLAEVSRYTRAADQAKLAREAMKTLQGGEKVETRTASGKPE